jgi:hypothetical protein
MDERLTWEEIAERYPNQWVGLTDVKYEQSNNATIRSAVVSYTSCSRDDLLEMMFDGKCIARYTTPDNVFQLGMIGVGQ